MNISIIIPSYKDPLLHRTIDDLLQKCETDFEIIPVLDGYVPEKPIVSHDRVKPVYLKDNVGMRGAINVGVKASTRKYICRSDEHCMFGKGFDRIILETIQDNWIVVPRRYFLDPKQWSVMEIEPVDYEKLKIVHYSRGRKFSGVPWNKNGPAIDETMAMQGSMWVMPRSWWDKVIGELQTEGYDTHYQDSHEMVFKTWKAGGKLMLNKNTWYAHKHRDFPRTHGYGGDKADKCFAYALSVWEDYYQKEVRPKWGI